MKNLVYVFFAFLTFVFVTPIHAEISGSNLPSMGNLAALIGKADKSKVEETVYNKQGKISANLPVPDTARGQTAAEMAKLLGGDSDELQMKMQAAILKERKLFEKFLSDANFAPDDMGVAYATCIIVLWELASNKELPQEGSLSAGKFLVHSFRGISQQYAALGETEKAKAYDWFMTTPVAFASLIKGLEKEGRQKEANLLRKRAASLFVEAFKLPHDMLTISDAGEIGIDIDKIMAYQKENELSSDW